MGDKYLKNIKKYLSDQAEFWLNESNKRPITQEEYHTARGKYFAYTDAWWKVKEVK